MEPKTTFTAETIHKLRQSLDEIAPYQATELSKQQAIRALSPQIVALRAKGYSWTAVAAMLSERGMPVSVAALRTYLRRVREEVPTDAPPIAAKRPRERRVDTRPPERSSPTAPVPAQRGEASPASKPPQHAAAAAPAVVVQSVPAVAPRREQEPRRSPVAARSDSDDL